MNTQASPEPHFTLPNGETVVKALERMSLTSHALALKMDVSPTTAWKWSRGANVQRVYRNKLARVLKAKP